METEEDAPPGVPEWVVTYGDMMSLLLTFFIMLVSLSEVVADKKYRAILEALQNYVGYQSAPVTPPGKNFPVNSLIEQLDLQQLGSYTANKDAHGGVKKESIEGDELRVMRTKEGKPTRVGKMLTFAVGSDNLTAEVREELALIADELGGKPNKIEVYGFASAEESADTGAYDNTLELTYARAKAVKLELESLGIAAKRMRVTASGERRTEPLPGTDPALMERQIEVLVLDAFSTRFVGPREVPK